MAADPPEEQRAGATAEAGASEGPPAEDAPPPAESGGAVGDEPAPVAVGEADAAPRKKKKKKKKKRVAAPPPEEAPDPEQEGLADEEGEPAAALARGPRRQPGPIDEERVDAPSRQILGMLAFLLAVVMVMWTAARVHLNARGLEAKQPRKVTTAELSRDPKSAALEMQLRSSGYDAAGALELAEGAVATELEAELKACQAEGAACERRRAELGGKPLVTAQLLAREPSIGWVRLELREGLGAPGRRIAKVERREGGWKVTERRPDDGSFTPPPGAYTVPAQVPWPSPPAPGPLGGMASPGIPASPPGVATPPGSAAAPRGSAAPPGSAMPPGSAAATP